MKGTAGAAGIIVGVVFGCVALGLGLNAISKAKRGFELVGGRKSAVAGTILRLTSAVLPVLLFIPIALTFGKVRETDISRGVPIPGRDGRLTAQHQERWYLALI